MILKTRSGNHGVETRTFGAASAFIPPPWAGTGYDLTSGVAVTNATASGLPAVGRAIRLIAGLVGTAMLSVFEGRRGDKGERPDSPQALLLAAPYPGMSDYDWRYDIAVSLEVSENAFIRKIKTNRGELVALEPIPHQYVNVTVDQYGVKAYSISTSEGWKRVPANEILHIRGQTINGGPMGVSRLQQHRDPLGAMLAAQRFEGAYFNNYARPDMAVVFPSGVKKAQADQWRDEHNALFRGPANVGKTTVMGDGATIVPIPVSMKDAQFIESRGLSVNDIARIMDVEAELLGAESLARTMDLASDRFLAYQMPPRLARIAAALKADTDLFPDGSPLYPEFIADPLIFASPTTRASVQHQQIQSGTLLADEARADNGRPPLPDGVGQIPQVTPVGGAPNPAPMPDGQPAQQNSSRELRDALTEAFKQIPPAIPPQVTVHVPEQKAPIVHVEPQIRVQPASVHVPPPEVIVNVPEQAAPVVNVAVPMPDMQAPDVIVNVPQQQPPEIRVEASPVTVENVMPQPDVHVHVPEQAAPEIRVDVKPTPVTVENVVNVPETAAPVINVEPTPVIVEARAGEQQAPIVNVNVEPTPVTIDAPVTVNVPPAPEPIVMVEHTVLESDVPKKITLERDENGNLKSARVDDA